MEHLPLAQKMILYHIRDTTMSAGPMHRAQRPRLPIGTPIVILLVVIAMLYFGMRVIS